MDRWYAENLVCPVDKGPLSLRADVLVSEAGRRYPIVDGVPVMLVEEAEQTIGVASASLDRARSGSGGGHNYAHLHLESLGISDDERAGIMELAETGAATIDPVVAFMVGATSGYTYKHLIGHLREYPIPDLRLPDTRDTALLDIGCNWGRWSIAAARKGYETIGIDPSLGAVLAARRVAKQLGLAIRYIVGDARYLPFPDSRFGVVFSYSVLQHLSKENVGITLSEVKRVLNPGGTSLIQMPNGFGIRSFYHQARRRFRTARDFEVRYWSVREMKRQFEKEVGPSTVSVDCYFGLGLQKSDRHLMTKKLRIVIDASERLRAASRVFPAATYVADSVYVSSVKAHAKNQLKPD